jgi:hypothetical protein
MFLAMRDYKVQLYDLKFRKETSKNMQVIKFYRIMAGSLLLSGSEA